jgi:hypothetical protein
MWILLAVALFIWLIYLKVKEPLDASPYDMVQEQSGVIQQLHDTISNITITEASIDALQSENDGATDQINQLQANLPSTASQDAYPTE